MNVHDELVGRANKYAQLHDLVLGTKLGSGVHGSVFVAKSQHEKTAARAQSAIKVHRQEPDYCRERDAYLRLKALGVEEIHACHVPKLVRYDDELLVIEMSVVAQPFVLDFAGAFLDRAPDFSDEVMAEWRAEKLEQFGSQWPKVEAILRVLESYGVFLVDVTPNNIALREG
jgi:hypothetical protein